MHLMPRIVDEACSKVQLPVMTTLHQTRLSQVPIRPSEPASLGTYHLPHLAQASYGPPKELSTLEHSRYNIVCESQRMSTRYQLVTSTLLPIQQHKSAKDL